MKTTQYIPFEWELNILCRRICFIREYTTHSIAYRIGENVYNGVDGKNMNFQTLSVLTYSLVIKWKGHALYEVWNDEKSDSIKNILCVFAYHSRQCAAKKKERKKEEEGERGLVSNISEIESLLGKTLPKKMTKGTS